MLSIKSESTFKRTVKVTIPGEDTDTVTEGSIVVDFRIVGRKRTSELLEDNEKFFDELVAGVNGMGDEDGNPYPPKRQLEMAKDNPFILASIAREYADCMRSQEHLRKN